MLTHRSHIVPLIPALNEDGSSSGHTTLRKVRTFREADGHRFVRWAEMGRAGQVAA